MLQSYMKEEGVFRFVEHFHPDAEWIDLLSPSVEEKRSLEEVLQISIPSQEEMEEIESSSRIYKIQDVSYMTSVLVSNTDSGDPLLSPVTFIFTEKRLITLRYTHPRSFELFIRKLGRSFDHTPISLFLGLLETIVDRTADILEKIGHEIDGLSKEIFKLKTHKGETSRDLDMIMTLIGKKGDLTAKTKESLVSLGRLLTFFGLQVSGVKEKKKRLTRIKTLQRDVHSITEHVTFLLSKINFLLDATLGYINIEQNNTIKIFSVAAVIFLPPTVIASIYGMNFTGMPELHWAWGYPFALGLMISSALLPYLYFKRRGWL